MGLQHGDIRQAPVLLSRRDRATSSQQTKGSSQWGYSWRKGTKVFSKEEDHGCHVGGVFAADHSGSSSPLQPAARFGAADCSDQSRDSQGTRSGISIENATWQLSYGWVCALEFGGPGEIDASSQKYCKPGHSQSFLWPCRDCGGPERRSIRPCKGSSGPESSPQALVNQIACNSGDPLQDMASSSASISSRGSMGRAKLQGELAAHKGVFFQNVRGQSAGS